MKTGGYASYIKWEMVRRQKAYIDLGGEGTEVTKKGTVKLGQ